MVNIPCDTVTPSPVLLRCSTCYRLDTTVQAGTKIESLYVEHRRESLYCELVFDNATLLFLGFGEIPKHAHEPQGDLAGDPKRKT